MSWLRRRRPMPEPHTIDTDSGARARELAEEHLDKARARWPEVHEVARSLRDLRERNHFAEQIQYIFEGGTRS